MTQLLANLLRHDIERLADEVVTSKTSTTKSGAHFRVIANGYLKEEGEQAVNPGSPLEMCAQAFREAKRLRSHAGTPARLTWRVKPQFEEGGRLYMRLAFETAS